MSPDRGDNSPLGSTDDQITHNGLTTELSQRQTRTETLRNSIVEMAGRSTAGPGQRKELTTWMIKYASRQPSGRLQQHQHEKNADQAQNATILASSRRRIDVDNVPTHIQQDPHRAQRQQQEASSSPHRPHPPTASPPSPKDRASAWLLRRFRRRHEKLESPPHVSSAKSRVKQEENVEECQEPVKKSPVSAHSSKRVVLTRPKSVKFQTEGGSSPCVSSNLFSTSSSGGNKISSTGAQEGNNAEDHKESGHSSGVMNTMRKATHTSGGQGDEQKAGTNGTGRSNNARVAEEIYEVRGSAIPTPPPRQPTARRVGLFSASLEAFKRRLRVSSSRYSQRLYGQEMEGVETYFISADDADADEQRNSQANEPGNPIAQSSRPQQKPSVVQRASTPFKPRIIANGKHAFTATFKLQDPAKYREPHPTFQSLSQYTAYPSVVPRALSRTRTALTTTLERDFQENTKGVNNEKVEEEEQEENQRNSSSKPQNSPNSQPTKFTYKLPEDTNAKEVSFNEEEPQPILPSVKTYVVENNNTSALKSKFAQAVPLTIHNLKLHDSLNAMYERRMRRLQRCNQNKMGYGYRPHESGVGSGENSDGSPSERMWQWLADVTEQTAAQPVQPPVAVHVTVESLALDSSITGGPMHRQHGGFTEPIFV